MAEVHIAHGFKDDLSLVETEKLLNHILDTVELLEFSPEMGSLNVPQSIKEQFGSGVRKLAVNPFDIITRYDKNRDVVEVAGLVHQKSAW